MQSDVKVWEEDIKIPTYGIGKPEKNPIFLEKRVYQGSSGVVYPFPVIEKIYDSAEDKIYHACFLENEYLKIMILPELGGRVQMAYDKTKGRHFIYYNEVIKPALVGLTGPWISGGIEFNWPQHHRPSTFDPVDFTISSEPDGSKTIWCNEIERMSRTKGLIGFTLMPGKAYLKLSVKLFNRTSQPQTFLWWANPAVCVNDDYQSVFPPDVNAVFDHGKRDVSTFPIATGTYYKVDYSAGVDISRYKNLPVPTSYMAVSSKYNFVGGYEHDTKGGLLHVANHHISPGKKQWTWGNGDFGQAWDRNLTDKSGPYIELMCGVYTDNQPDFTWLMPYEEKSFEQYFMPYRDLGLIKNATKEAMLNLEINKDSATVKVYTTSIYNNAKVVVKIKEKIILEDTFDFSPKVSFDKSITIDDKINEDDFEVIVSDADGKVLVNWKASKDKSKEVPQPAVAAKFPEEIEHIEQLFLTGQHLEQYRHATYNPTDYYLEALKRDPGDVRNNNAMGLWLMRRGQFAKAESYFRTTIKTLTERNPNPYDGEPYFNLGKNLKYLGKFDEAFDAFYKSVWNAAWQDAGYFELAQIVVMKGNYNEALELVDRSLIKNWHNHKARHLKSAIFRKLGKLDDAIKFAEDSLDIDKFNIGCLYEMYIILTEQDKTAEAESILAKVNLLMRGWIHNYIEYALDYSTAGLYDEASQLLSQVIADEKNVYPMVYYFLGYFADCTGNRKEAIEYYNKASQMKPDFCFPNRLEEVLALQNAIEVNPKDSMAPYYLGNFWYANRQYNEALECWEKSALLNDTFPTVWRNLSLSYYNKFDKKEEAVQALEKAFNLDTSDARILMELDQLYKKIGKSADERLKILEDNLPLVDYRDDLYLERVTLYNYFGKYSEALQLLNERKFHPWEGGEGKVTGQYILSLTELAKQEIKEKKIVKAIELLEKAKVYPDNLGEGKLVGAKENDINYWLGCAYEIVNQNDKAVKYWRMATIGESEPSIPMYYNDQKPDDILYQGLALLKLGKAEEAKKRFNKLIDYGNKHISDDIKIDYFAVSLPDLQIWDDDLNKVNRLHCQYLIALGYLGQDKLEDANELFNEILNVDKYYSGAHIHQQF
ncbi:MAG: DUF5107 domain-containing protein [Ignavibacteria bacterium]|jgi:tetratricopeptide (TPR) repeat protein